MNILADENVAQPIVLRLRAEGHRVEYVLEEQRGSHDDAILGAARQAGIVLLTDDKDFGELVYRHHLQTFGVVLIRLSSLSNDARAELLARVIREHELELLHAFTVVTPGAIRIRRPQPAQDGQEDPKGEPPRRRRRKQDSH